MSRPVIAIAVVVAVAVAFVFGFGTHRASVGQPPLPERAEVPPLPSVTGPGDAQEQLRPDPVLLATTVAPDAPERRRAHILDRATRSRFVLRPDQLVPGYDDLRLVEIDDGHVILDYAGQSVALSMNPEMTWPEDPNRRPAPVKLANLTAMLKPMGLEGSEEQYRRRFEFGRFKLYAIDLGLRTNSALYTQGAFASEEIDGRQVGYRLTRVNEGSFWDTLGLEADDLILAVNGITIEGPESNREAVREIFRNATEIRLLIDRDGERFETHTLTLPVASGVWSDQTGSESVEE